jgi:hypothetical protein
MIRFKVDGYTIKRRALISKHGHLVPLGVDLHAFAFRPINVVSSKRKWF